MRAMTPEGYPLPAPVDLEHGDPLDSELFPVLLQRAHEL